MLNVSGVAINFDGQNLFSNVNLQFLPGNCYGIIGANGAGKSTFLRILSGDLEPSKGDVSFDPKYRMSVLKQDHFAYESQTIFDTIMQGNARLFEIAEEKEALYAKPDFSEEDGNRAAELEAEFAELNGWEAETEAAKLMQGLGLDSRDMYNTMSTLNQTEKVKVLLARALFGAPDMILLDEPTNGLDAKAITWLEDFLIEYEGTVIVVSHDRHFLNNVCTHIVDVDYGKIKMYVGNYEFWYESAHPAHAARPEPQGRGEDQGAAELHPALFGEQVEVAPGDLAQEAAREDHGRGDAGVLPALSVRRLHDGPRARP